MPAGGACLRGPDGAHHAHTITVLGISGPAVSRIVSFFGLELFPTFGLPLVVPSAGPRVPRNAWLRAGGVRAQGCRGYAASFRESAELG